MSSPGCDGEVIQILIQVDKIGHHFTLVESVVDPCLSTRWFVHAGELVIDSCW